MNGSLVIQKILNEVLLQYRLKNPAFSLRALARKLELSPAALCEILNGKRPVTRRVAEKVLHKLAYDPVKTEELLALFQDSPRRRTTIVQLKSA